MAALVHDDARGCSDQSEQPEECSRAKEFPLREFPLGGTERVTGSLPFAVDEADKAVLDHGDAYAELAGLDPRSERDRSAEGIAVKLNFFGTGKTRGEFRSGFVVEVGVVLMFSS